MHTPLFVVSKMADVLENVIEDGNRENGDSEEGERERSNLMDSQDNENLTEQVYDAFHEKCGDNVVFCANRTIARRKTDGGIVFSSKPIPLGGMFQVKLLEKVADLGRSLVSILLWFHHRHYLVSMVSCCPPCSVYVVSFVKGYGFATLLC